MSTASTPAIPAGSVVKVVKSGDSLLGKVFKVIEEKGEHILAEIKTEAGIVEAYFEKKHVNVVAGAGVTHVTKAEAIASAAAAPTAKSAEPEDTDKPSEPETAPEGTPEPEQPEP